MNFLKSAWSGLTFDNGKFSTKKSAYTISIIVTSWIVLHLPTIDWTLFMCYALHATGPGTIREFLAYKTNRNIVVADTVVAVTDNKKDE